VSLPCNRCYTTGDELLFQFGKGFCIPLSALIARASGGSNDLKVR
jgi:hypothetical protein